MKFFVGRAAIVATAFLIFVNCFSVTAQVDSIYRLPTGTRIRLKMDAGISSKVSSVNDTFTAVVAKAVVIRETVVLAAGTVIEGRISSVSRAASGGKNGKLEVVFETLWITNETRRRIDGVLVNKLDSDSSQTANFLTVIGGAAIGAVIGAVSKTGSGALIGAGIGAGAGTGVALLRKGRNVGIRGNEEFEIELKKEVLLPVLDY